MQKIITEEKLSELRENVAKCLSERRYKHTLEVEKMATKLAEIYCPEKIFDIRAAALLHDITKEYDEKVQISMLSKPKKKNLRRRRITQELRLCLSPSSTQSFRMMML